MRTKFSEQLRRAIDQSGQTRYGIAKATGIAQPVLSRYCNNKVGLSMETIDTLCSYLGLELVKRPATKPARRAKGR
jgi:transcriptional regulator with XRE-family HTH domain